MGTWPQGGVQSLAKAKEQPAWTICQAYEPHSVEEVDL